MITLAKTAREARLIIKYGSIGLVILILLVFLFRLAIFIKDTYFPPAPPPPEEGFGKLPKLDFKNPELSNITYRINTITGFLPTFSDRTKVYKFAQSKPFILSAIPIRERLRLVGFSENEVKLDEITYRWAHRENPGITITYNILTNNFTIDSQYIDDETITQGRSLFTSKSEVLKFIYDFLSKIGEDISDINFSASKISYYRIHTQDVTKTQVEVQQTQDPQIAKVVLQHTNINELPIYYPQKDEGLMNFYVAKGTQENIIVKASYIHRRVSDQVSSSYPIKTADEAFNELTQGNGYLVTHDNTPNIDILNVSLGYFEDEAGEYLLPIYIFEGVNFKAFTQAISDQPLPSPNQ